MSISDPSGTESIFQPAELSALSPTAPEPNSDGCVNAPGLVMMSWSSSVISQPQLCTSSLLDSDLFFFFFFRPNATLSGKASLCTWPLEGRFQKVGQVLEKNINSRWYCGNLNHNCYWKTNDQWPLHSIQTRQMIQGTRKLVSGSDVLVSFTRMYFNLVLWRCVFRRKARKHCMKLLSNPFSKILNSFFLCKLLKCKKNKKKTSNYLQAIDDRTAFTHFSTATVLPIWNVSYPISQLSKPFLSP